MGWFGYSEEELEDIYNDAIEAYNKGYDLLDNKPIHYYETTLESAAKYFLKAKELFEKAHNNGKKCYEDIEDCDEMLNCIGRFFRSLGDDYYNNAIDIYNSTSWDDEVPSGYADNLSEARRCYIRAQELGESTSEDISDCESMLR